MYRDSVVVADSSTGDDLWWKKVPDVGSSPHYVTSGDGQTLYGRGDGAGFAVAWDGKSEIRNIPGFLAAGYDGRRFALLDDRAVHIRASASDADQATLPPSFVPEEAVFVDHDRALALADNSSRKGPSAVVEIATGKVLYSIPPIAFLSASPSGGCLAIRSEQLEILDAATGDRRGPFEVGFRVLALDDECRNVVTLESLDFLSSGASRFTAPGDFASSFRAAALPPNGREVVIADGIGIERFPLLSRDELIAEALRRVGSKFDTECQKYLERPCPSGQ
jgi:hypothetical protein